MLNRLLKDVIILVLAILTAGAVIAGCFHDRSPILPRGYVLMPGEGIYKVENSQLLPLVYKGADGQYHPAMP